MMRFGGCFRDIFKILNKSIDEGYKIFCLADRGYIFDFRMSLRSSKTSEVESIKGLN